jgi:Fe-S-cluster containining protein
LNIHFNCTQCAKCCNHTKIPVTVTEAIDWLKEGHQVQVICEASPSLPQDDLKADYLVRRSFAARSGSIPMRISVTLVANIAGSCPNLLADLRCGIYERRPLVCRIYPAEINPFTQLDPAIKACPPEAWGSEHPVYLRDNRIASQALQDDIQRWRNANEGEVPAKHKLCAALNLTMAAINQEGFFIHSPRNADLLEALASLRDELDVAASPIQWLLVSDRDETLQQLAEAGAAVAHPRAVKAGPYEYIGLMR